MLKEIVICFAVAINSCYCNNDHYMELWTYGKIRSLVNDILVVAINRIHQTDPIRDLVSSENGFQVGLIMGRIRDKYKTMLELYRMCNTKYKNNPELNFPAMPKSGIIPLYYISRMELIHILEVDIENLVQILESIPKYKLIPSMSNWVPPVSTEPPAKGAAKLRPPIGFQMENGSIDMDMMKEFEDKYKSEVRDKYYLRVQNLRNGNK